MPFSLEILLALPFVMAAAAALLWRAPRSITAWLAVAAPLGGLLVLALLTPAVLRGEVIRSEHAWLPQIGLMFSLRLDGLAWMFFPAGAGYRRTRGAVCALLPERTR